MISICRDECLTLDKCEAYRQQWARMAEQNPQEKPTEKVIHISDDGLFRCLHRSAEPHRHTPCEAGCKGEDRIAPVYRCEHFGTECTIHNYGLRIDGPTSPSMPKCLSCDQRIERVVKVNADAHGMGDAVLTACIAEGAKQGPVKLIHAATRQNAAVLKLLGQEVTEDFEGSITTYAAYHEHECKAERGSVPRAISRGRAIGINTRPKLPSDIRIPEESLKWAEQVSADHRGKENRPIVLLFPMVHYTSRRWPYSYWVDVAWKLHRKGYAVIVMTGTREEELTNVPYLFWGQPIENIAALMLKADLVVGNDSGPANLSGALNVPTIAILGPTKPTIFAHAPSVTTMSASVEDCACVGCHFGWPYRAACDRMCLGLFAVKPETVIEEVDRLVLSKKWRQHCGIWCRPEYNGQDENVVGEVIRANSYRLDIRPTRKGMQEIVFDIGAHVGTFASEWRKKNPSARITCVEACPENLPILRANVGGFAQHVIHAACTYEPGKLYLLNSCKEGGTATGGSTVVRAKDIKKETFGHLYWEDRRPLPKMTLERLMSFSDVDHIDVLKLDCEGSEFSILENTKSLDRIGFICGEYHGEERWTELVERIFKPRGWGYYVPHRAGGLGIFHLQNPKFFP